MSRYCTMCLLVHAKNKLNKIIQPVENMYSEIIKNNNMVKRNVLKVSSCNHGITVNANADGKTTHFCLPAYLTRLFEAIFTNLLIVTIVVDEIEYIVHQIDYSNLKGIVRCVDLVKYSDSYLVKDRRVRIKFFSSNKSKFDVLKDFVFVKRGALSDLMQLSDHLDVDQFSEKLIKSQSVSNLFAQVNLVRKL